MMKRVEFNKESSLEQMPKIKFFLNFIFSLYPKKKKRKGKKKKFQIIDRFYAVIYYCLYRFCFLFIYIFKEIITKSFFFLIKLWIKI